MKTILSIPLIILILFTGIRIDIGTHYCGGSVAGTKISLDAELASCGMEQSSDITSPNGTFSKHCCEDTLSEFAICNNYIPSTFAVEKPVTTDVNNATLLSDFLSLRSFCDPNHYKDNSPPGINSPNSVALPALCIFRI